MAEIASIFQIVNIGVETTSGTPVSANKRLSALMIEPQIKTEHNKYRGSGYKFPSISSMSKEWVEADLSGPVTYTELVYLLSSVMGTATSITAGTTDQTWVFDMDIDGADTPKTYTVEWGDATRALEFAYGLVRDLTLSFSRESAELSGTMLGYAISDGITLTSSPTAIALLPAHPTELSVKFADAQASLTAASVLTRVVSMEWALTDRYNPAYFINSSTSWTAAIEGEPKLAVKVKMEKDAAGMGLITQMRTGATKFIRIAGISTTMVTGAIPYSFQIDTACKVISEPTFSDEDGIACIEWEMEGFIDSTWGRTTQATVVNNLSSL